MKQILNLANRFQIIIMAQDTQEIQPGEIADGFPMYFPNKMQQNSPLTKKLNIFVSNFLPSNISLKIDFLVEPGFKPNFHVIFIQDNKSINNLQWFKSITEFLFNELRDFKSAANARYTGRKINNTLTVATYTI